MSEQRIAVISDIHGNIWALDAVLADIRRRGIEKIINLGDCFYGPLRPAAVADILVGAPFVTVRGNSDRRMAMVDSAETNPTVLSAINQLSPVHREWLGSLAFTGVYEENVYLCHGTPADDHTYLLEEVSGSTTRSRSPELVAGDIADIAQPVILCGHSHIPKVVYLPDGRIVVNPGSVGLPAFDEDQPHFFKVESGSPHAKYAIIAREGGQWGTEQIYLPYDWQAAARQAEANHRPDWAKWLRTGMV